MQNNNKGFSLVEMIIVVAIMAIMIGVASLSFAFVFGKEAQKCAYNISATLDQAKGYAMAKSGSNEAYVEISKVGTSYIAKQYVPTNPVKGSTFFVVEETKLGTSKIDLKCVIDGTEFTINGANTLKVYFDRLSGGLKEASVGGVSGNLEYVMISYGRKYKLTPSKATGKHVVEKIN